MRTTILLDDRLAERMQAHARREGKSFSAFLADAGRKALESNEKANDDPFNLITFRGNGTVKGIELDKTNEVLAAEDLATYGENSP